MAFLDPSFIIFCVFGSILGFFVGALPGLSVTMATAILVSFSYTWQVNHALAMVMGIYVVGVYSGALSAILLNIPGAPSSVATTLDGYPMTKRGEAKKALVCAAFYSFTGCVFGLIMLALLAGPVSAVALQFWPMDYFLLALFGLVTIGRLSGDRVYKGLISAALGFWFSLIGMDPVHGTPRFTFGAEALVSGIPTVPALIGLFGMAGVLWVMLKRADGKPDQKPDRTAANSVITSHGDIAMQTDVQAVRLSEASGQQDTGSRQKPEGSPDMLREALCHFPQSLLYSLTGTLIGALPGAGTPVASLLAYAQAKRLVKHPSRPFGEGAVEGIVASESANNACIGGALIPMLTLGIPGDAVTAIILSVFTIHGLQPGPLFLAQDAESFHAILSAGFISCVCLLLLGLFVAPRFAYLLRIPQNVLMPVIALICVFGAYAGSRRVFDVCVMLFFGVLGLFMRRYGFPVAPVTLALVLGRMMESNLRRALSLASSADHPLIYTFRRPLTLLLLALLILPPVAMTIRRQINRNSCRGGIIS
ncbi:MAG: tripartite tricarboxylate transporter permease [Lachnospiraceae bacterium]|nr:tripartite tricarboxylate transporter permease [Lachnospiraceae bacterium]